MSDTIRRALMAGLAVVVALSLVFGSVAASEADESREPMASMEPTAPMEPMEPGLVVREPWTRQSMMLELAGAAYMVIHNGTDLDDALVGASSPAAGVVELHLSAMDEEGMMSMTPVEAIPIPAHGEAVLEPGGYHVMLIDLLEPLVEGAEVEISLQFETAPAQTLMVPVRAEAPMSAMDMGGMDMGGMDMGEMDMGEMDDEADEEEVAE